MWTASLIFFLFLASGMILLLKPAKAGFFAAFASCAALAWSLVIAFVFEPNHLVQFGIEFLWIQSLGIHFSVGVDGISLLMVLLTTFLTPFIIVASMERTYEKASVLYGLILLMEGAMIGVFTAMDGFLFYVFWEMALIPIYLIILIFGGHDRVKITLKFFLYTLAGSLFMLIAFIYLYLHTPDPHLFDIRSIYHAGQDLSFSAQSLVFWGIFLAFAIKIPVFPFHTWQPDTYTVAPTSGTMLLSGIMLKMGIYGIVRWLIPVVPAAVSHWGVYAIALSVIGIVYASLIAFTQKDLKRLIAYSSIAHVGLIAAGTFTLSTAGLEGALLQMFSHGIIVIVLFFVVDILQRRAGTSHLPDLQGIKSTSPVLATVFMLAVLGSIALPLTSGFIGEFLLLNAVFDFHKTFGITSGFTIIFGAVYMLRAYGQSMLGEGEGGIQDLNARERWVLFPLVAAILLVGIYPQPLFHLVSPAVKEILDVYASAFTNVSH